MGAHDIDKNAIHSSSGESGTVSERKTTSEAWIELTQERLGQ